MVDRFRDLAVRREPLRGTAMERAELRGVAPHQPLAQILGEELVIAVGLAVRRQRRHEHALLFEPLEDQPAVLPVAEQVDDVAGEPVEKRRPDHDFLRLVGQGHQHLLGQVARQFRAGAMEALDELAAVDAALQRQRGKLQRDRPTLGALDDAAHIVAPELLAMRAGEQRLGLERR